MRRMLAFTSRMSTLFRSFRQRRPEAGGRLGADRLSVIPAPRPALGGGSGFGGVLRGGPQWLSGRRRLVGPGGLARLPYHERARQPDLAVLGWVALDGAQQLAGGHAAQLRQIGVDR